MTPTCNPHSQENKGRTRLAWAIYITDPVSKITKQEEVIKKTLKWRLGIVAISVIPLFEKRRQEDCKFEVRLGCIVGSRPV